MHHSDAHANADEQTHTSHAPGRSNKSVGEPAEPGSSSDTLHGLVSRLENAAPETRARSLRRLGGQVGNQAIQRALAASRAAAPASDPSRAPASLVALPHRGPLIQRSLTTPLPVPEGVFEMGMQTAEGAMVLGNKHWGLYGTIKFKPDPKATYANKIALIQVARTMTAGPKPSVVQPGTMPAATGPLVDTAEDKKAGVEGGFHTDVYHLDIKKKGSALSPNYAYNPVFGFKRSEKADDIKSAELFDSPGGGGPADWDFSFETVAKADDSEHVYGAVKWSFGVRSTGKVVNEAASAAGAASATFAAALEKHREFYVREPIVIYFDFNKPDPSAGEDAKIDEVLPYLRKFPDVLLKLESYGDTRGSVTANMQVATQRAKAVERLLVGKGIAAARISPPVAKGKTDSFTSDAKTPQDEEANRRGNRRVVVTFSHPAAP